MSDVRVRFAPSPTGYLHIGGVRTALFNWLLARHEGGTFILRIEDTDQSRSTEEAIQVIEEGMRWVGLDWDEGPYRQTDRLDLYRDYALKLFKKGAAFWCDCTAEGLEARRKEALTKGLPLKYNGCCREKGLTKSIGEAALRFRAPSEGETVVEDLIKGTVRFDNTLQDDLILLRSNGYPTYNFSVVIDDALMGITHVIRGDDHLNNTPRQVPLFQALELPIPQFGHLSMIFGSDKAKLSKRHGAISVMAYKEMGYLPEALINYLVRLGWSMGDQEIFSLDELTQHFSLDHVQKSAAVFNPDKLLWLNSHYMREGDSHRLGTLLDPFLDPEGVKFVNSQAGNWKERLVLALKGRSQTLVEMAAAAEPYIVDEPAMDDAAAKKFLTEAIAPALQKLTDRLEAVADFSKESQESVFHAVMEEEGLKMGKLAQPVRVALTGRTASPGIYEVLDLLGKERTLSRLRKGIARALQPVS